MIRSKLSIVAAGLLICAAAGARVEVPPTAQSIMSGALKASKEQKKPVWLIFDASW